MRLKNLRKLNNNLAGAVHGPLLRKNDAGPGLPSGGTDIMDRVLAHITDLHLDDFMAERCNIDARKNTEHILNDIGERGIGTIVITGDFGESAALGWLFDRIKSRGLTCYVTLGNHDEARYFDAVPALTQHINDEELYYTIETPDITALFIDTSSNGIGIIQKTWIGKQIHDSDKQILIFSHHPVFDCGNTAMDKLYPLQNRDEIGRLLLESGKKIALFCGHYHTSHEQRIGMITQYVTKSAAVQVKRYSEKIEVESLQYGYRIIRTDGGATTTEEVVLESST